MCLSQASEFKVHMVVVSRFKVAGPLRFRYARQPYIGARVPYRKRRYNERDTDYEIPPHLYLSDYGTHGWLQMI